MRRQTEQNSSSPCTQTESRGDLLNIGLQQIHQLSPGLRGYIASRLRTSVLPIKLLPELLTPDFDDSLATTTSIRHAKATLSAGTSIEF